MLINFFLTLRKYKVAGDAARVDGSARRAELQRWSTRTSTRSICLSRTCLVKDEKNYDKFDRAFSVYFKGLERPARDPGVADSR